MPEFDIWRDNTSYILVPDLVGIPECQKLQWNDSCEDSITISFWISSRCRSISCLVSNMADSSEHPGDYLKHSRRFVQPRRVIWGNDRAVKEAMGSLRWLKEGFSQLAISGCSRLLHRDPNWQKTSKKPRQPQFNSVNLNATPSTWMQPRQPECHPVNLHSTSTTNSSRPTLIALFPIILELCIFQHCHFFARYGAKSPIQRLKRPCFTFGLVHKLAAPEWIRLLFTSFQEKQVGTANMTNRELWSRRRTRDHHQCKLSPPTYPFTWLTQFKQQALFLDLSTRTGTYCTVSYSSIVLQSAKRRNKLNGAIFAFLDCRNHVLYSILSVPCTSSCTRTVSCTVASDKRGAVHCNDGGVW